MISPLLIGKVAAAAVILGGCFYLGYSLAEGNAAKEKADALEQLAREYDRRVKAAEEDAERAEAARRAVATQAENERASMATQFARLQREAGNAQLRRAVVAGKGVDLDPLPFTDEFVRLLDDAARATGGTRESPPGTR